MKKTLSIVLALVMMLSICIPAFAATNTITTAPGSGLTKISTTLDGTGITEDGYFTVTIPANTTIKWGEVNAVDLHYTVESHFSRNKRLHVAVAGSGQMQTADGTYTLAYTLNDGGETNYDATQPVVLAKDCPLNLKVAADAWNTAVVETYTDTLTFNVSVS